MSLRKQAASLAIMHAADVLQPLLVLPYAGRVLGPLHFGQYAYVLSVGWLAATIVEYGFHWTAQPCFCAPMLTSVGGILFPAWLFIALERAWQAAIAVVVGRSLALVCFLTMVTLLSPNP